MRSILFILSLLPLMAFANSNPLDPGNEVPDSELAKVHGSSPLLCAKSSQFDCYGRAAHTVCVHDRFAGRAGVCNPQDDVGVDGTVTCVCM